MNPQEEFDAAVARRNHPDGYGGARDAELLAAYADAARHDDVVRVQAVNRTKKLLRRAGFSRLQMGEFYEVRVVRCDRLGRLQLAPLPMAGGEDPTGGATA